MLNKELFSKILTEYQEKEKVVINIHLKARIALKHSKVAIFELHRNNEQKAIENLDIAEKALLSLQKEHENQNKHLREGIYHEACEEFAEAHFFYNYITKKEVIYTSKVNVYINDILGGLSDLTGEILRKTIVQVTSKNYNAASINRRVVADIVGELIKLNLVGHLRHKYDIAKGNLKKLEEISYEISLRKDLNTLST